MNSLVDYYSRRAREYEAVYEKPERQPDLLRLADMLSRRLAGHDVLELACGTGYWTERYAAGAGSILGVDASAEMLRIAESKFQPGARVDFRMADVFSLPAVARDFSACFCGFFWSHIPTERLPGFLDGLWCHLAPGALVVFIDNRYVDGSNTPISRTDRADNTYQLRRLDDGSQQEVLKNFPSRAAVKSALGRVASDVEVESLEYFWAASGRLRLPDAES